MVYKRCRIRLGGVEQKGGVKACVLSRLNPARKQERAQVCQLPRKANVPCPYILWTGMGKVELPPKKQGEKS